MAAGVLPLGNEGSERPPGRRLEGLCRQASSTPRPLKMDRIYSQIYTIKRGPAIYQEQVAAVRRWAAGPLRRLAA